MKRNYVSIIKAPFSSKLRFVLWHRIHIDSYKSCRLYLEGNCNVMVNDTPYGMYWKHRNLSCIEESSIWVFWWGESQYGFWNLLLNQCGSRLCRSPYITKSISFPLEHHPKEILIVNLFLCSHRILILIRLITFIMVLHYIISSSGDTSNLIVPNRLFRAKDCLSQWW